MYNKLFSKIVFSSIWLEPMPTRIVWIAFLATMDEDGFVQCSAIGNVASMANVSLEEALAAVETLQSPDLESGNPNHEGRRIERVPGGFVVLNAKEHRDAVTREIAKQQNRERVRKHRMKKQGDTPCNAPVMVEYETVTPSEVLSEVLSEAEKKKERESISLCPESVDPQHWKDWLAVRKRKHKVGPPTKTAIARVESEAAKAGVTLAEAIRIAAEKEWRGFEAEWMNGHGKQTKKEVAF